MWLCGGRTSDMRVWHLKSAPCFDIGLQIGQQDALTMHTSGCSKQRQTPLLAVYIGQAPVAEQRPHNNLKCCRAGALGGGCASAEGVTGGSGCSLWGGV